MDEALIALQQQIGELTLLVAELEHRLESVERKTAEIEDPEPNLL